MPGGLLPFCVYNSGVSLILEGKIWWKKGHHIWSGFCKTNIDLNNSIYPYIIIGKLFYHIRHFHVVVDSAKQLINRLNFNAFLIELAKRNNIFIFLPFFSRLNP